MTATLSDQLASINFLLDDIDVGLGESLTDAQKTRIHAYIVLAHACIEEYLEDLFENFAIQMLGSAAGDVIPRSMLGFTLSMRDAMAEKKRPSLADAPFYTLNKGSGLYKSLFIEGNQGIKSENIKKLAQGLGLDWRAMDSVLSRSWANLDTLGVNRGEAGHLSPFTLKEKNLTREVQPENAKEWVDAAVESVQQVEDYLKERLIKEAIIHPPAGVIPLRARACLLGRSRQPRKNSW